MISGISGFGRGMDATIMAQMRQNRFAQLDTNGDGGIDKTELQAAIDEMSEKTGKSLDLDVEEIFAQLDADGDGQISVSETPQMRGGPPPPPPGGAQGGDWLTQMDTNGDGVISIEEMQAASAELSEQTGLSLDVEEIFGRLDVNGDGTIDSSERPQPPAMNQMDESRITGTDSEPANPSFVDLLELLEQQEDEEEQINNYALLQYLNQDITHQSMFDVLI